MDDLQAQIDGCFGFGGLYFASHPNDEKRAKELRKKLVQQGVSWAELEQAIRAYLGEGVDPVHKQAVEEQIRKVRKFFEPSLEKATTSISKKYITPNVNNYTKPSQLRNLMANAKRLGREEVWREAFQRLCEIEGGDQKDPLQRDFHMTLAAYEELLSIKNGRTTSASRTRQKLKNKGLIECLEDWAVSSAPTEGFELLVKNDLAHLTGEYLVLKYPDRFSEKAVTKATQRLSKYGISVSSTNIS